MAASKSGWLNLDPLLLRRVPDAKRVAVDAAPGVVFAALADHQARTLAVDAPKQEADAYIESLEKAGDHGYILTLAEIDGMGQVYRHALIEDGQCRLVHALSEDAADESFEAVGLINLWAVAAAIAKLAPRPLLTLVPPRR